MSADFLENFICVFLSLYLKWTLCDFGTLNANGSLKVFGTLGMHGSLNIRGTLQAPARSFSHSKVSCSHGWLITQQ